MPLDLYHLFAGIPVIGQERGLLSVISDTPHPALSHNNIYYFLELNNLITHRHHLYIHVTCVACF